LICQQQICKMMGSKINADKAKDFRISRNRGYRR
jgi:hypothetical protein